MSKSTTCKITFVNDVRKTGSNLTKDTHVALYRICQEALNNAIKHSQATRVIISITEFDHKVSLFVSDNGVGFTEEKQEKEGGKGLKNMKERVLFLNGEIFINSNRSGTTIEVEIPL